MEEDEDEDEDPQELKGDDEFHALNNDLPQPSNSHGPSKLNEPEPESQLEITENVQLKQEVQPTTETETAHQEDESISDVDPKHTGSGSLRLDGP